MKWITPLVLLAGCASVDPTSFRAECENHPIVVSARAQPLLSERDVEERIAMCQRWRVSDARRDNSRTAAVAAGIILGAGSAALAEHNFYVYEVPRAMRYLDRR